MKIVKKLVICICSIGLLLGIIFLSLTIVDRIMNLVLGENEAYIMSGNLSVLPIIGALLLVLLLMYLYSPLGIHDPVWTPEDEEKPWKSNASMEEKLKITGIGIGIFILLCGISVLWQERFTMDGVETFAFGVKKSYTWEDVESLQLKRDLEDMLVFQLEMKDGNKCWFNGGFGRWVEYSSDAFEKEFGDQDDYMYWVAEKLKDQGVPLEIKDKEQLLGNLGKKGDYWSEVAKEIMEIYE